MPIHFDRSGSVITVAVHLIKKSTARHENGYNYTHCHSNPALSVIVFTPQSFVSKSACLAPRKPGIWSSPARWWFENELPRDVQDQALIG